MTRSSESYLPAGHVIDDRYRIDGVLGSGGMGTVYRGEHLELGRRVAIKVLHGGVEAGPEALERLRLEARAAAAVRHPAVVDVMDVRSTGGTPYIVMELLEGESLADLLHRERRLDPSRAVAVAREVLEGLALVHAKGFVHRDLKPENIFVSKTADGGEQIKILDFGISKCLVQPGLHLTRTGTVLGTPYFMAPEQARGAKDVDERADVWALGVVLYVATTGRYPYEAASYNELLAKLLTEPFPKPRDHDPSIPTTLERVILRAMCHEVDERYRSSEEFLAELRSVQETLPPAGRLLGDLSASLKSTIEVLPATRPGKRRAGGRRRVALAAAVACGLVLAASLLVWTQAREPGSSGAAGRSGEAVPPTSIPTETAAELIAPTPPPLSRTVVLSFGGVPDGVDVFLDGRAVVGGRLAVPAGDDALELRIERGGRVLSRVQVTPDRSQEIDVGALAADTRAVVETPRRSRPAKAPVPPATPADAAVAPEAPAPTPPAPPRRDAGPGFEGTKLPLIEELPEGPR